ncbi:site-specific integrase [Nocardioides sp. CER19]|uniref:tyrosine-type recombinase/integrase n=1 Tax=Nocardioides sp. CER19 TaxID=3038538 RepID=UPI00244D7536|nr:site-specific integrase [Nocardioides sp. CER19]MDH2415284.1 site-specific integrase [Nocardioides sp. CER19]
MNSPELRLLSPDAAEELGRTTNLRAEALAEFRAGYPKPESLRTMAGGLNRVVKTFTKGSHSLESFPWETVDRRLATSMIRSVAAHGYSRRTVAKDASALRVMIDCCREVGLITHAECRAAQTFEIAAGVELPQPGHFLSEADVVRIIRTCEHGSGSPTTRIRDVALLLALASTAARGDELTQVDLIDVHLDERRIWLRHTKSGKPRDAWLHPTAVAGLSRWLELRGRKTGPLFVPMSRVRPLLDRGPLSTHQAWKMVQARALEAGFEHITPHDFRRFVITTLLADVDLVLVAKIVGHTNPATTALYDRRPAIKMREAVATLQLPAPASLRQNTSPGAA